MKRKKGVAIIGLERRAQITNGLRRNGEYGLR